MIDFDNYTEIKTMALAAQMHYRKNIQQREIAKILKVPQAKISRLLKKASDEGYIKLDFRFPHILSVAVELIEKYRLRDAIVIPSGESDFLREDIGQFASRYFERMVGNGANIGISCGVTLYHMVQAIRNKSIKDIKIYPLASDNTYHSVDLFPNTLVGMLAAKFRPSVTAFALPAQILSTSKDVTKDRQKVLEIPEVKNIFLASQNVDIAFVGVGNVGEGVTGFCELARQYGFSADYLRSLGAVAEYNYTLIDKYGESIINKVESNISKLLEEIAQRIINVSLEDFQKIASKHGKLVVCLAGGKEKLSGIQAVLQGKLANVLITDQETAKALLEIDFS
jgi:deoxyribonucleoside regulator